MLNFLQKRSRGVEAPAAGERVVLVNEAYIDTMPSAQAAVDCIPGWVSRLPEQAGAHAGTAALFDDQRLLWALEQLGGVQGQHVLELGPLEGAHTWTLEKAGAAEILAIEASQRGFLKCLITKELLGLRCARFMLGNFMPWLQAEPRRFDLVVASGVLYHMTHPLDLLSLLAATTDRLYLWTHYIPDDVRSDEPWMSTCVGTEDRDGIQHHVFRYGDITATPGFIGGVRPVACRLRLRDIRATLDRLGFRHIWTTGDHRHHSAGPCIAIAARK